MVTALETIWLVTQSDHTSWLFAQAPGGALYYRWIAPGMERPGAAVQFIPNGVLRYSIAVDPDDRIHVACLDRDGHIVCWTWIAQVWSSQVLFRPSAEAGQAGGPVVAANDAGVHVCYTSYRPGVPGAWAVCHHRYLGSVWNEGNVLASGTGRFANPPLAQGGPGGSLHLAYRAGTDGAPQLCYRRLLPPWETPGAQVVLSRGSREVKPAQLLVDGKQQLHLVWTCPHGRHFEQVWHRSTDRADPSGRTWRPEHCLATVQRGAEPALLAGEHRLFILWLEHGRVIVYRSCDDGLTWTKAELPPALQANNWELWRVTCPPQHKKSKAHFVRTYGSSAPAGVFLLTPAELSHLPAQRSARVIADYRPYQK